MSDDSSEEDKQTKLTEFFRFRKGEKKKTNLKSNISVVLESDISIEENNQLSEISLVTDDNESDDSLEIDFDKSFLSYSIEPITNSQSNKPCEQFNLNMAKKIDLNISFALKVISQFDGTPSELHQFLECCDLVHDDLKDSEHNKFLRLMKKLLVGKAYNETVKHNDYETWNDLKIDLKSRYSEICSKLQISQELNTISQRRNECVKDFGSRVQNLLSQLNDICITEAGAGSERFVESLNSHTALIAFQEGLNNKIRLVVKAANCKSLNDSIAKAAEEEVLNKRHETLFENKNDSCQICGKKGHLANKCFSFVNKSNINSHSNSHNNSQSKSSLNYDSKSNTNRSEYQNITCAYCKKKGHHIEKCFLKIKAENNKTIQSSVQPSQASNSQASSKNLHVVTHNCNEKQPENSNRLEHTLSNRAVRAKDL